MSGERRKAMKRAILTFGVLAGVLIAGRADAALIDRGTGMIYDTVLNITWLQDANLAATNSFGVPGAGSNMTWYTAERWIAAINAAHYKGFSDWRLPYISVEAGAGPFDGSPVDCSLATELACRDNEYGYMYYHNLGGKTGDNLNGNQGPFTNIQPIYWSGTRYNSTIAWDFFPFSGFQGLGINGTHLLAGWAVRPGDDPALPEPSSGVLLGPPGRP
jgi:hypothetical protein